MAKKKITKKSGSKPAKKSAKLPRVPPIEGALISLVAFLEFADDEEVDPDSAVNATEGVCAALHECSPAEKNRLREALRALTLEEKAERKPRAELVEYYESFFENLGLDDDLDDE